MKAEDRHIDWFLRDGFSGFINHIKNNIRNFSSEHIILESNDEFKIKITTEPYYLICRFGNDNINEREEVTKILMSSSNVKFIFYYSEKKDPEVRFYTKKENFLKQIKIISFTSKTPDVKLKNLEYNKINTFYTIFTKETHNDYIKIFINLTKKLQNNIKSRFITIEQKKYLTAHLILRLILITFLQEVNFFKNDDILENRILKKEYNFYQELIELFNDLAIGRKGIEKLDGDIFILKDYEKSIQIPDSLIKEIIIALKKFNYTKEEFGESLSEIDPSILSSFYEIATEMKDYRSKLGIYYTPINIADYITSKTLTNYFIGVLEREIAQKSSDYNYLFVDMLDDLKPDDLIKFYFTIKNIRILDNAVGSGTFLYFAYQFLFSLFTKIWYKISTYAENQITEENNQLIKFEKAKIINSPLKIESYISNHILNNNIFGIDIDETSILITKYRLWLAAIYNTKMEKRFDYLPKLQFNILSGNSLLGEIELPLADIRQYHKEYLYNRIKLYNEKQIQYKLNYEITLEESEQDLLEIEDLKNEINNKLKEILIPKIQLKSNTQLTKNQILNWENIISSLNLFNYLIEFPFFIDEHGFDIILGNPPYNAEFIDYEKEYFRMFYTFYNDGYDYSIKTMNSASLFIERSINCLKGNGIIGYIVPKSLCYIDSWQATRNGILDKLDILSITDLKEAFEAVKLEQIIFIGKKNPSKIEYSKIEIYSKKDVEIVKYLSIINYNYLGNEYLKNVTQTRELISKSFFNDEHFLITMTSEKREFYEKIINNSIDLKDICNIKQGFSLNKYFREIGSYELKRSIRGRDIERYGIKNSGFIDADIKENIFDSEFIGVQRIVAHITRPDHIAIIASLIPEYYYPVNTITCIQIKNKMIEKYSHETLLTVLNSSIYSWYCYNFIYCGAVRSMDFRGNYAKFSKIPIISIDENRKITKFVRFFINNKVNFTENEILIIKKIINAIIIELFFGKERFGNLSSILNESFFNANLTKEIFCKLLENSNFKSKIDRIMDEVKDIIYFDEL